MARLVGTDDRYHRSDHGAAACGTEARRPRPRETERMRPCPECYPPAESTLTASSRKPSTAERAPDVWAAVLRRSGSTCEIRAPRCWRTPVKPHHRLRQGQGGPDTAENIVAACDWCHTIGPDSVHGMGARAYDLGLLIRSTDGPPTTPWTRPEDFPG